MKLQLCSIELKFQRQLLVALSISSYYGATPIMVDLSLPTQIGMNLFSLMNRVTYSENLCTDMNIMLRIYLYTVLKIF